LDIEKLEVVNAFRIKREGARMLVYWRIIYGWSDAQ
jgi:hypothetical protein